MVEPINRALLTAKRPHLVIDEQEPDGSGSQVATTTIFLTASECPVGCNMCDLYRHTLTTPTPVGAIPAQIDHALADRRRGGWIKLYNSGNFFDPRSIPPADHDAIADRCDGYSRVIVENHPRFGAERLRQFRDRLQSPLEIAVGLETVQPRWLDRLGKRMSRDDFDRYARWLRNQSVDVRVFLIVGMPETSAAEAIRWARLSTRHAVACGARHVSLIPARSGHGWNGLANHLPELGIECLSELQIRALGDVGDRATVTIDLWDIDPATAGLDELRKVNLTQRVVPR